MAKLDGKPLLLNGSAAWPLPFAERTVHRARASWSSAPTGTSGTQAAMYEIEAIDDERLKQNIGPRVQLDGTSIEAARRRNERRRQAISLRPAQPPSARSLATVRRSSSPFAQGG
jgi:hypothetical protein